MVPGADAYALLFSFNSRENQPELLRLLQVNASRACEEDGIIFPHSDQIQAAPLIAKLLSSAVYIPSAAMHLGDEASPVIP